MLPILLTLALAGEAEFRDNDTNMSGKYTLEFPAHKAKEDPWLLVFFHGAGGGPSYAAQNPALLEATADRNMAILALQAPNNVRSWPDPSRGAPTLRWRYVSDLLKNKIFAEHRQLSPQRTIFVGWSAGSTFIGGDFLPHVIGEYLGGAILLCGGGTPTPQSGIGPGSPASEQTRRKFKLYYTITQDDFLYRQTAEGLRYWEGRGLDVSGKTLPSGGHCGFDLKESLRKGLDFLGVTPPVR